MDEFVRKMHELNRKEDPGPHCDRKEKVANILLDISSRTRTVESLLQHEIDLFVAEYGPLWREILEI